MMYVIILTWLQDKEECEDVLVFVKDGIKFVEIFSGIIDKSTPHLYLSALPFLPSRSTMAGCLLDRFPGIAKIVVGKHHDWPSSQQVLQGHEDHVNTVAFSPDGRHIVSGSTDETILLWDAQTGSQIGNPLKGHTSSVSSVVLTRWKAHCVRLMG